MIVSCHGTSLVPRPCGNEATMVHACIVCIDYFCTANNMATVVTSFIVLHMHRYADMSMTCC